MTRATLAPSPATTWALALHGGAGTIERGIAPDVRAAYHASLRAALAHGADRLAKGDAAVDVVEGVVRILEDDPLFNAGRGAVFTSDGAHELDASIMDGRTKACGAVAGVTTVKNPVTLARAVMEKTRHVLLAGPGAEAFADVAGVERVPNAWFSTDARRARWQEWRARSDAGAIDAGASPVAVDEKKGTVGAVARDVHGHLAAATSTGGLTGKRWGRVGDSPVVGAGTYADDATAAVSCTGTGEELIRHAVAHTVSARIALRGEDAEAAARGALAPLQDGDGGLVVVDAHGRLALVFNTTGMYRGAADATGRFETAIHDDAQGR